MLISLRQSQGFNQNTDVILLTTNLFKKELRGVGGGMKGVYEAGLAINGISNIVTEELARDLLPELTNLTSHPQPYVRKKAILCLFKLFVKYPQGLRLTFAKIQSCLQDSDPSVVSCAVNVITELSDKNPKNYLHLAPAFFELLTRSSNNWMLIKVVKLLGSLVPEEPRLARKLLDPLATIVRSTQAKSLLFEAVHTITLCLPYCRKNDGSMPANVPEIVLLCAQTLRDLVEQTDQNLKYLGLVGFASLMQSHPRVLSAPDYRPLILACLSDQDVTIRSRALDLLSGMASRKNLMELVGQLMEHVALATAQYKLNLVAKIIEMCSKDKYAMLQDFKWYLDILFQLGHMRGVEKHGELLRAQVTDVALRVLPVRPFAVRRSIEILLEGEGRVSDDPYGDNGRGKHIAPSMLPAIAWIIGEYSDLIRQAIDDEETHRHDLLFDNQSTGTYHAIIQALTIPSQSQKHPASTHKIFVQAALKVLAAASADNQVKNIELTACVSCIQHSFAVFMQSTDVEVVERSFSGLELLKSLKLLDSTPGLTPVDDDSSAEGDLLGMGGEGDTRKPASSVQKSLSSKLREVSDVLTYTLKPAPMKPIGAKTQRKKRDAFTDGHLDMPIDVLLFQDLVEEEMEYRQTAQLTVDSVSFTQQQPLRPVDRSAATIADDFVSSAQSNTTSAQTTAASTSFQHPANSASLVQNPHRQKEGDPFYLDSGAVKNDEGTSEQTNIFGAIQLVDSDGGSDLPKKTKKKKKKKKHSEQETLDAEADKAYGLFTDAAPIEVYHSDDDEDAAAAVPQIKQGKKGEFLGLSQVDLTTPLREDEVMPERRHHVVPERTVESRAPPKSKKKSKKQKKSTKEKKRDQEQKLGGGIGDLLDLGDAFGSADTPSGVPSERFPAATSSSNRINSAVDDLLGLEMPPSSAPQSAFEPMPASSLSSFGRSTLPSENSSKAPWMRASVKSSDFALSYLVSAAGRGLMLTFKIANHTLSPVNNISLAFRNQQSTQVGDLPAGASSETGTVGPFPFPPVDSTLELKGVLHSSEGETSIKVVLPASTTLSPEENLSLDDVAEELGTPGWASHSAKIQLLPTSTLEVAKKTLCDFLHAAEVSDGAPSSSTGTLASRSSSGARVRVLVKVQKLTLKVDVKSTSPSLAKALASNVKRLVV